MYTLVLLRHGESTWNRENRFTGWTDVDLTEQGRAEAMEAGRLLRAEGFDFDVAPPPRGGAPSTRWTACGCRSRRRGV